jgi:hypothetical protein
MWGLWRSFLVGHGYIAVIELVRPSPSIYKIAARRSSRSPDVNEEATLMERFPVYPLDSAPEASKSALRDVQARFGMIPNLAGAMATSPVLAVRDR